MRFFTNYKEDTKKRPRAGRLSWLVDMSILAAAAGGAFIGFLVFCLLF